MRTVWQVFLRDCKRILRNPVAAVVTLGVAVLPSLYAWFNILANWDPYSATGNLQVAVANEDRGTTNDLVGHLNAGKQVVTELKHNDQLGWRFVSNEEQAVQGVQTGDYYAAIVLPKDFSASLVDSLTGTSKQPKIKYYVNEKKNAIAPKITDTGATTIDEQINSTFVTTVSNTVAAAISQAGDDLDQATNSTQNNVVANLGSVLSTIATVQDALTDLRTTLNQSDTALADARSTTASLQRSIIAAQQASQQSGDTGRLASIRGLAGKRTGHQLRTTFRTDGERQQCSRYHQPILQHCTKFRRHYYQRPEQSARQNRHFPRHVERRIE